MKRLFVAVDLPEEVKQGVTHICRDLPGAHWVGTEQLHLTLRFIGEVDDALFAAVTEELGRVFCSSFTLELRGIGCFPSPRRPRVVWVGVTRNEYLFSLQREVERAVIRAGTLPDEREFSPHLTLARLRDGVPSAALAYLARHEKFQMEPFLVETFHLYSSTLTRSGAIHLRESSYPLEAPSAPAPEHPKKIQLQGLPLSTE